jgi:hypothetical protein
MREIAELMIKQHRALCLTWDKDEEPGFVLEVVKGTHCTQARTIRTLWAAAKTHEKAGLVRRPF